MATCLELCEKWSVGGYARGGMRGPLGQIASSPSSGTSFFSDPQRRARFPGSESESSDVVFRNLIFSAPQRRARFPGSANVSFCGPLKSQWTLQAFADTLWVCAGYARPKGMAYPAKRFPPSGLEKHACAKRVCARVCALYIYILLCTLARGYARGYAHHIYMCFPEN